MKAIDVFVQVTSKMTHNRLIRAALTSYPITNQPYFTGSELHMSNTSQIQYGLYSVQGLIQSDPGQNEIDSNNMSGSFVASETATSG